MLAPTVSAWPAHDQPYRWSTLRARHRLGMKTAVYWVGVFTRASRAEREAGHGRQRPVIGQVANDGEARAAVGAVNERVQIAPVGRVKQLAQAIVAQGHVWRHRLECAGHGQ